MDHRLFTKLIVKFGTPIPKFEKFDRFLFVAPHPDDIEVGAGGTAAKLCRLGKEVEFLVVTDGSYGCDEEVCDRAKLAETREKEALASAEFIGAKGVTFLRHQDGGYYSEDEIQKQILKKILECKADVVFAPDHLLKTECHPDHLKTGRAATTAFLTSRIEGVGYDLFGLNSYPCRAIAYYYTDRPNLRYKIKKVDMQKQIDALKLFKSQFKVTDKMDQLKMLAIYIRFRALRAGFWRLKCRAEEFRVIPNTRMHCFTEER